MFVSEELALTLSLLIPSLFSVFYYHAIGLMKPRLFHDYRYIKASQILFNNIPADISSKVTIIIVYNRLCETHHSLPVFPIDMS